MLSPPLGWAVHSSTAPVHVPLHLDLTPDPCFDDIPIRYSLIQLPSSTMCLNHLFSNGSEAFPYHPSLVQVHARLTEVPALLSTVLLLLPYSTAPSKATANFVFLLLR